MLVEVPASTICKDPVGFEVPIPTFPLPLTYKMLLTAGESISNKAADDAPEI